MNSMIRSSLLLVLLATLAGCATREPFQHAFASGYYASEPESCVPYARRVSSLRLYGDADSWWQGAEGKYERGTMPKSGAALVLKKTGRMRSGHVAVVKDVVDARKINVTQSNWGDNKTGRSIIYQSQLAVDVSAQNDWSRVRFWNDEKNMLGFPYEAYGFIYP